MHCTKQAIKRAGPYIATVPFAEDARASGFMKKLVQLPNTVELFEKFVQFIHTHMDPVYANIRITKILHNEDRTVFICNTAGAYSSYCLNVQRDHSSSSIYFYVDRHGMSQKCFSRKEEKDTRARGLCSAWKSPPVPLTLELLAVFNQNLTAQLQQLTQLSVCPRVPRSEQQVRQDRLDAIKTKLDLESAQLEDDTDVDMCDQTSQASAATKSTTSGPVTATTNNPPRPPSTYLLSSAYAGLTQKQVDKLSTAEIVERDKKAKADALTAGTRMTHEAFGVVSRKRTGEVMMNTRLVRGTGRRGRGRGGGARSKRGRT